MNPAEATDAAFLEALYRGGELLQQGQVPEARDHLERAYQMRPGDEKAKNLLGLAYFKLGDFVRAAEVYEALVRENGADPTLRVNLGLVYLKSNQLTRAVREFETAVELQPGHLKAHNYLGLALAQAGQYGRAREHFVKAGSEAMAEKMAKALAAEARPVPVPPRPAPAETKIPGLTQELPVVSVSELSGAPAAPPIPLTEAVTPPGPVPAAPLPQFGNGTPAAAQAESEPPRRREPPAAAPVQQFPPPAAAVPPAPDPAAEPAPSPRTLREAARTPAASSQPNVRPTELTTVAGKLPGDGSRTFTVTPEAVRVEVRGEVLVRTAGLLGWTGVIEARAEFKRFRGRVTDKPFGWGPARMHRLVGSGTAWLGVMGRTFLAVDLGDESVYLREDWVFGFEEPVMFENGRVPSEVAPDLDLVHLSGMGQVLLALPGPLRSTEVRHDAPVTVPLQHWVGWQGQLSPRVVALGWEGPEGTPAPAVELSGEGLALLCVPTGMS
ncbi:MAG TPA: tetratricopeptide repeat protein [Myxococcaceae bacterium]